MENICYIVGALKFERADMNIGPEDFTIAADAGFMYFKKNNIKPDIIIGDFDSLGIVPNESNVIRHAAEKDDTDMMLAIKEGMKYAYKKFVIYGGLGGRLDHTLANIQSLCFISECGGIGYLINDDYSLAVIKNGTLFFDESFSGTISVFCMGELATGVSLSGLKYPLEDATMRKTSPIGVSNEFLKINSSIGVNNGELIVIWRTISALPKFKKN
ncbi:MAG: thiamine diphosphokinase [Clostridia bacterium]